MNNESTLLVEFSTPAKTGSLKICSTWTGDLNVESSRSQLGERNVGKWISLRNLWYGNFSFLAIVPGKGMIRIWRWHLHDMPATVWSADRWLLGKENKNAWIANWWQPLPNCRKKLSLAWIVGLVLYSLVGVLNFHGGFVGFGWVAAFFSLYCMMLWCLQLSQLWLHWSEAFREEAVSKVTQSLTEQVPWGSDATVLQTVKPWDTWKRWHKPRRPRIFQPLCFLLTRDDYN